MKPIYIILIIIILAILGVLLYGMLSYQMFNKTSFLSEPADCMPKAIAGPEYKAEEPSLWTKLFGSYCAAW